jgi:hypothetical protein
MGRGLNTALNLLESATRGRCHYCSNKLKRNYWYNDNYPGKEFCKKTCLNKYIKIELMRSDTGCSLCGRKTKSLKYHEDSVNNKKYCKIKCAEIALSDAIVLRIEY